ncbi:MAG TPA: hypothetical protein GXZ60_01250 [Intrasporangiaceae bacterium]|nr:hypothetical protein [Intrasporangiaceae bacterium]
MVGRPEFVVLDEPTSGLDPQGQQFLRQETRRLRDEGRTVLLSTHDVEDAARLADDVVIIDHGHAVASGSPRALVHEHCRGWRAVVEGPPDPEWAQRSRVTLVDDGDRTVLYVPDADTVREMVPQVRILEERPATLHDAYFMLTGTTLRA